MKKFLDSNHKLENLAGKINPVQTNHSTNLNNLSVVKLTKKSNDEFCDSVVRIYYFIYSKALLKFFRTKLAVFFIVIPSLLLLSSCNEENIWTGRASYNDYVKPKDTLIEKTTPMFDSLKGEWNWFYTSWGHGNKGDNTFTTKITFLSQNKDSSINYEIIVEDTLFSKCSFKIPPTKTSGYYRVFINLPLKNPWQKENNLWGLLLSHIEEHNDILIFWDYSFDGFFHYYQRIVEEN